MTRNSTETKPINTTIFSKTYTVPLLPLFLVTTCPRRFKDHCIKKKKKTQKNKDQKTETKATD